MAFRHAARSIPEIMRAATIPNHGPASLIEITNLPLPEVTPSDLLIKVEYAGLNFIDTYQRSGLYPNKNSFPMILGNEGAGEVVKLPTDPKVLEDPDYKRFGLELGARVAFRARGAMAEYVTAPFSSVFSLPSSVPTRIGAAAPIQGLTALSILTEAYAPKPNDWILVHTAAGGLGLLLTQIAKSKGAKVIGTTSSEEKAAIARANGADEMIIYTKEDTVARVLEITGGEGVHAVLDGVGHDTWENNFKLIRRKGTIVSIGNASGVVPPFSPLKLGEKNVTLVRPVLFNYVATPAESYTYWTGLWDLISREQLKIRIHKEYSFTAEGIQQSHGDIVSRDTVGKLIVKIP